MQTRWFQCGVAVGLLTVLWLGEVFARKCGGLRPCRCGDLVIADYRMAADLGRCVQHGVTVASNVTLDCQNHVIRGMGSGSKHYGIQLRGATAATIKNCEVHGFRHGIRLREASRNRLVGNNFHHNGDFDKHVGYGIAVHRSSNDNHFENNQIHNNADEGIHFGESHRNTLIGNRIYDNFRENVYLLRSNEGLFKRNKTWGGKANSIYVKHSSRNRFEDNIFHNRTARIRGDSHHNYFMDNELIDTGIDFQSYLEQGKNTHPTNNLVVGGTISGGQRCLSFDGASANVIRAVKLTNCNREIVSSFKGIRQQNTVIGVRLDPGKLSLERKTSISVGWLVDISIEDTSRAPVEGARIRCIDVRGELVFEATTRKNGTIPTQNVIQYTEATLGKTFYTPHTFHVETDDTKSVQTIPVDRNKKISIMLK